MKIQDMKFNILRVFKSYKEDVSVHANLGIPKSPPPKKKKKKRLGGRPSVFILTVFRHLHI